MFSMRRETCLLPDEGVDNPRDTSKMTVNNLDLALEEITSGKSVTIPVTIPIGCKY